MRAEYKNRVLSSLPKSEIGRLQSNLEPVLLPQNQALAEPGEKMLYGYFLEEGMASIVVTMKNGATVEVGIVGQRGSSRIARIVWDPSNSHTHVHADWG